MPESDDLPILRLIPPSRPRPGVAAALTVADECAALRGRVRALEKALARERQRATVAEQRADAAESSARTAWRLAGWRP